MARPVDIVRKIAPRARSNYLAAFERGDALLQQHGITTRRRLAEFLAQIMVESGGLTLLRESGNYSEKRLLQIFGAGHHSAKVTPAEARKIAHNGPAIFERVYGLGNPSMARRLGNTQPGDGWKYRGNGLMQTTGRYNHRVMGRKCGVDFEGHPELVTSAEHALKPALHEWTQQGLNGYADRGDTLAISRAINLGDPHSTHRPNGAAEREAYARKILPLIDSVDLVPMPVPPDVEPVPLPKPKPEPKAPNAKTATISTTLVGSILAALASHQTEIIIGIIVAGIVAAVAIHFLWPKKEE